MGANAETNLREFTATRWDVTARLAIVIIADAVLFGAWIGVALAVHMTAVYVEQCGVLEYFAIASQWASGGATFLLTVLHMIADLRREWEHLFGGLRHER